MRRYFVWALGAGFGIALSAAPAVAQTHVDIGVWTPNGGGRVVLGSPRVFVREPRVVYVPRPRRVVYASAPRVVYVPAPRVYVVERGVVDRGYRHDRGRHAGWDRRHPRGRFVRAPYEYREAERYRRR